MWIRWNNGWDINCQLKGEEPKINSPENSRDMFGNIILNTNIVLLYLEN